MSHSFHPIRSVTIFFAASFFLHLLWENLQAPLFAGYTSFGQHFWICFKATLGDLLSMLVLYAALAVIHRNLFWVDDRSAYTHPATWMITPLVGMLLAVSFELWAVNVDHRWEYAAMPLVPIVQIGLLPFLQMIVVPLAVVAIALRIALRMPQRNVTERS